MKEDNGQIYARVFKVKLVIGFFGDDFTSEPITVAELAEMLPVLMKPSLFGNGHFDIRIVPA